MGRIPEFAARAWRCMMAAALAIGVCIVPVGLDGGSSSKAYAVSDTITGSGYVYCVNPGQANDDGDLFDVTMPDGSVLRGHCIDYGIAYPADGWYGFTGYWNGSSYDIYMDTAGATPHPLCVLGAPCQRVANFTWTPNGAIDLQKVSSNPSITNGNPCYSLAGAVYGVYSDSGCGNEVASLTTDGNGYARAEGITAGNYWVREKTPSAGYALDRNVYPTTINAGATSRVNGSTVSENPNNDPVAMIVGKYDGTKQYNGSANLPTGSAGLSGAQYTVSYYAGQYSLGNLPSTPTREWVFETDANGFAYLSDQYKISGPSLYYQSNGTSACIPVGTVVIKETKAPEGYNLSSEPHLYSITSNPLDETVRDFNTLEHPETIKRGNYKLIKSVETEVESTEQPGGFNNILVEGAAFELYNASANDITSPQTGQQVAPGGLVCTIVSDASGIASTTNAAANGWAIPDGWTGALAYGTYTVKENIPQSVIDKYLQKYGIQIATSYDWTAVISEEGQDDPAILVTNKPAQTWLKIQKQDSETGKAIPLQASFQIFDAAGELVTYSDFTQDGKVVDTWTTNGDGDVGLPMKLAGGSYTVVELAAPEGYALDKTPVPFTVDEYGTVDAPLTVICKDVPVKGNLTVAKSDSEDGAPVAGATYEVRAAEDIVTGDGTVRAEKDSVVATITTGADGKAVAERLYLGKYTVSETLSPEGWALDTAAHEVTIASQGQTVPVVAQQLPLSDQPTGIEVLKKSSLDGSPLAGAEFTIYPKGSASEAFDSGSILSALSAALPDSKVALSDEAAMADDIAKGKIGESVLAKGMVDDEAAQFRIDLCDGHYMRIFWLENDGLEVADVPARLECSQQDKTFVIVTDGSGMARLDHIAHGDWEVRETKPADGCMAMSTEVIGFTVDANGLVSANGSAPSPTMSFEVENTPLSLGTTAADKASGEHEGQASKGMTIVDTVAYTGLLTDGREYRVEGVLVNRETGEPVRSNGTEVTATKSFVPAEPNGSIDIEFSFDGSALAGSDVVAFEELYLGSIPVISHEDIEDEGQTVSIIDIGTTALADATNSHVGYLDGEMTITDTVSYTGLKADGRTYVMKGALMTTDGTLLVIDGKSITAVAEFEPASPDGTVDLVYTLDSTALAGTSTVVYEDLYSATGTEPIAIHEDLSDEGQTVGFPSIGTTAVESQKKSHEARAIEKLKIVDTVAYEGLEPGRTYHIDGVLIDKATGNAVVSEEKEVWASADFVPEHPNGTVDVTFEFNARALSGTTSVAYEFLFDAEAEVLSAEHADIDDQGQTVQIGQVPPSTTSTFFEKTGEWIAQHWLLIGGMLIIASALSLAGAKLASGPKRS